MSDRISVRFAAALVVAALVTMSPAGALSAPSDDGASASTHHATRHLRPRIEVRPERLLYRECVDGYREVLWPDGVTRVVMPYMHCRWVRR